MIKKIFVPLIVALVVLAGFALVFEFNTSKQQQKDTMTILRGENALQIAGDLKAEGYISSKIFFVLELVKSGNFKNLKAGVYDLKDIDQTEIIYKLVHADTVAKTFTVLPGWDIKDIAAVLEKADFAKSDDFLAIAKTGNFKSEYDFLADAAASSTLEGYLFPDTYEIPENPGANDLARLMLDNFGKKITPDIRAAITKQNKSIYNVLTMASMLEKEVKTLEDKKVVAGILYKRREAKMPLQVDSTLLYFAAGNGKSINKEIDSPYNTYKYAGLPAGPICNPGLESIEAAIEPLDSPYWYYLSAPDGATIFSKNYDEHLANIAKYLTKSK